MAISAKFIADFSSFNKAVQSADAELDKFDVSTKKVNSSLQKLVTSFSGDKIKAEAALAEEAVLRVGGASKLTAEEQAKVNKIVEEAIGKYKALGQEAPKSLQMLADETKKVTAATEPGSKAMSDFGAHFKGVLAGMISAQAIIGAVGAAFGALKDFVVGSIKAYADAELAQKKLAAALVGIGQSTPQTIGQMNKLAETFAKTTVHSDDLITEMEALLVQVGTVMPHQMEGAIQAAADLSAGLGIDLQQATMLVGKAFEGNVGPLKRYGITIDETKLAAEGMPAVLNEIQKKFGGQAAAEVDSYAGSIKQLTKAWEEFQEGVGKAILTDPLLVAGLRELAERVGASGDAADKAQPHFLALATAWATGVPALGAYIQKLEESQKELDETAVSAKRLAAAIPKKPVAAGEAPPLPPIPPGMLEEQDRLAIAQEKATEAAKKHAEAIKQLTFQLSDANLQGEVKKLQSAFVSLKAEGALSANEMQRLGKAAKTLYDQGATLTPELFRILLATERITPEMHDLGNELKDVGTQLKFFYNAAVPFPGLLEGISGSIGNVFAVKMPPLVEEAIARSKRLKESWSDLSKALAELATIAGGTFGKMVSSLGSMIAAANTAKQSLAAIKDGMNAKSMLESLTSVTSGVLGLVTVAIQAGQALAKIFDRNKGRDMVEAFAETMGGFDALHAQLLTLGEAGEQLWIALTQRVGANSPEQAAKAIAEVEAALAAMKGQTEETTVATEEQAQAQIETATEAAKALEELGAKLTINADEWGAWSDRVTHYLDDLAKSIRAMPVPAAGGGGGTSEPGFATGTHGQFVDFGAGTSVRLHGRERISTPGEEAPHVTRIYIDGRKVAEASARYIPEVMEGRF